MDGGGEEEEGVGWAVYVCVCVLLGWGRLIITLLWVLEVLGTYGERFVGAGFFQ